MGKDEQMINVSKEMVLRSLNQHLKRHPEFQKGMRVDDIQYSNGDYYLTPNFLYGGKNKAVNHEIGMKVLKETLKNGTAKPSYKKLRSSSDALRLSELQKLYMQAYSSSHTSGLRNIGQQELIVSRKKNNPKKGCYLIRLVLDHFSQRLTVADPMFNRSAIARLLSP